MAHGNPLFALLSVLMFFSQMPNNDHRQVLTEIHHNGANDTPYYSQAGEYDYLQEVAHMALQRKSIEAERIRNYLESPEQPGLFAQAFQRAFQRVQRSLGDAVYPFAFKTNVGINDVFNTRDADTSWYNPTSPGVFTPASINNAKVKAAAKV